MEKLKQSQEILDLGKQLIEEFSLEQECSLTMRWMSHYLAECMHRAAIETESAEKSRLEKECVDTILLLWKSRKNFPGRARPLSNLKEIIGVLSALVQRDRGAGSWEYFIDERHLAGWPKFAKEVFSHLNQIIAICLHANLLDEVLKQEKKWLHHTELLSEEEREILERLDELISKSKYYRSEAVHFSVPAGEAGKTVDMRTRIDTLFEKLQEHIESVQTSLATLREEQQNPEKQRRRRL